jgi:hypothetical protein
MYLGRYDRLMVNQNLVLAVTWLVLMAPILKWWVKTLLSGN